MFEAIHGSAPLIAGKNIANPSGLLRAAIMMLNHIGEQQAAMKIKNAWSCTIEEGIDTADIYKEGQSSKLVNTSQFAEAVIERLGKCWQKLAAAEYDSNAQITIKPYVRKRAGCKNTGRRGYFCGLDKQSPNEVGTDLQQANAVLTLQMITNRGVKVWPDGFDETFCTDHWRCRFTSNDKDAVITKQLVINLLQRLDDEGVDVVKTENLYNFDGVQGYSLGQGQ